MCDTVVATASVTRDGTILFGKNSDRLPNEGHHLLSIPEQDHPAGSRVQLTYIDIPQVEHTYAVLLAKPFWIWGAEMGTNQHGVTIGNEAIFTRLPYVKDAAPLGMDLLRLGLERGRTAQEALQVITRLLAEYGQGGNHGFQHNFYYHSSYLLADFHEAWLLETAGQQWAAKQVQGIYTISNGLTLTNEWDLASPDLVRYAVTRGWCKGRDDFDFARCYSEPLYTRLSECRHRCQRTTQALEAARGRIDVSTVMAALRDHGGGSLSGRPAQSETGWLPGPGPLGGLTGMEVCAHAGYGPVRANQTTGSMVSHLHPTHPTHFVTASAAPCTSIFKPVWVDIPLPDTGPQPSGVYDPHSLFWQHERLHRQTLEDYPTRHALYAGARDELEQRFVTEALACASASAEERAVFARRCFAEAAAAEATWLEWVQAQPARQSGGLLYRRAWRNLNRKANMPD